MFITEHFKKVDKLRTSWHVQTEDWFGVQIIVYQFRIHRMSVAQYQFMTTNWL